MNADMSFLSLITEASLLVQLVMLLLVIASLMSWTIIFTKRGLIRRTKAASDEFEANFWSGGDLNTLYRDAGRKKGGSVGMASIFESGFREFTRLSAQSDVKPRQAGRRVPARHARRANARGRSPRAEPRNARDHRLDESLCGPVRHRDRHHEYLPAAGRAADRNALRPLHRVFPRRWWQRRWDCLPRYRRSSPTTAMPTRWAPRNPLRRLYRRVHQHPAAARKPQGGLTWHANEQKRS